MLIWQSKSTQRKVPGKTEDIHIAKKWQALATLPLHLQPRTCHWLMAAWKVCGSFRLSETRPQSLCNQKLWASSISHLRATSSSQFSQTTISPGSPSYRWKLWDFFDLYEHRSQSFNASIPVYHLHRSCSFCFSGEACLIWRNWIKIGGTEKN